LTDEIRIGDQHPRRFIVRPEFANRLAGLNEQRFVIPKFAERPHDRIKRFPTPRGAPGPAVDD